jgi:phage tail-like protein
MFRVEFEGLNFGSFQEFSGLSASNEVYEIKEGGLNSHAHKFVTRTSYGDLTLKRGFVNDGFLFWWFDDASLNTWTFRMNGSVIMMRDGRQDACRWNFFRAFPIKWEGPSGNASSSGIAIETLTLACEWVELEIQT